MFTDLQFATFPGRPWRHLPPDAMFLRRRWPRWRGHPCAPLVEAMLKERGLDDIDILIVESGPSLAVETPFDVRFLAMDDDAEEQAVELADLARDLDHVVAWRIRDFMIQAAMDACGLRDWVIEPPPSERGRRGPMTDMSLDWSTPLWAFTASTPLLRQLAGFGVGARDVLKTIRSDPPSPRGEAWAEAASVLVKLHDGRLHCTCHGNGAGMVSDLDGFDLLLELQHLPETIMTGARGRRLSALADIASPPPLLRGLDPVIESVEDHEDALSNLDPCTRIRLEATTETLADIPQVALDAVGVAGPVARTVKPWLTPGLRADGTPRFPGWGQT